MGYTHIPGSSVAYRSLNTLSLTDIPVYTPGDRPPIPQVGNSVADRYSYTLSLTGIRVLQVTGGYTRVQCSLQILLYFVADRYSGPGERLLYPKLHTDTLYSTV